MLVIPSLDLPFNNLEELVELGSPKTLVLDYYVLVAYQVSNVIPVYSLEFSGSNLGCLHAQWHMNPLVGVNDTPEGARKFGLRK